MCGRYVIYETTKLADRFGAAPSMFKLTDSYNVAPGEFMPVVIRTEQQAKPVRTIELMKWGLVPQWAKDTNIGYKMINARAETAFDKPAWRGPVKYRRCLIPANGFYEWRKTGVAAAGAKTTKQPFFIHPTDQELFAFAGLYDTWHDAAGNELWTFSICTTEANKDMAPIHDRMPVILSPDEEAAWLDPARQDRESVGQLLHPYPDGRLAMHPVSTDVNTVRNDEERLIYPLNST
jgi:putative SOS response-associated peptidase YedK